LRRSRNAKLPTGVDDNCGTCNCHATDAGDKSSCLGSRGADARRGGLAGNPTVAEIDIVITYSEIVPGVNAHCDVKAACCVVKERMSADGRVKVACCIMKKRDITVSRVMTTGCVGRQRFKTIGGIVATDDVVGERLRAGRRIIAASGVVLERSSADGGVEVACRIGEER